MGPLQVRPTIPGFGHRGMMRLGINVTRQRPRTSWQNLTSDHHQKEIHFFGWLTSHNKAPSFSFVQHYRMLRYMHEQLSRLPACLSSSRTTSYNKSPDGKMTDDTAQIRTAFPTRAGSASLATRKSHVGKVATWSDERKPNPRDVSSSWKSLARPGARSTLQTEHNKYRNGFDFLFWALDSKDQVHPSEWPENLL